MSSNESVFDRLYRQSTAASRAASVNGPTSPTSTPSNSTSSNRVSNRQRRQTPTTTKQMNNVKSSMDKGHREDAPTGPPVAAEPRKYAGPWRIASSRKCDSESKNKVLPALLDLQSLKLSEELRSFEQGDIDARQFACRLIASMFDRDHMAGRHWDYDPPSASSIECAENNVLKFKAEKEATWDWKDIYSVATAKGTISFYMETNEILVEGYSYYAAG